MEDHVWDFIRGGQAEQLVSDLQFDLQFGHHGTSDQYPGFAPGLKQLTVVLEDLTEVWEDEDGEVHYDEPYQSSVPYLHHTRKALLTRALGPLAEYL